MKSNLVGKYLDFSDQDTSVQFQPVDFQNNFDSTVLVRERTKGSKLEPAFARKSGKITETPHTISITKTVKDPKRLLEKGCSAGIQTTDGKIQKNGKTGGHRRVLNIKRS